MGFPWPQNLRDLISCVSCAAPAPASLGGCRWHRPPILQRAWWQLSSHSRQMPAPLPTPCRHTGRGGRALTPPCQAEPNLPSQNAWETYSISRMVLLKTSMCHLSKLTGVCSAHRVNCGTCNNPPPVQGVKGEARLLRLRAPVLPARSIQEWKTTSLIPPASTCPKLYRCLSHKI